MAGFLMVLGLIVAIVGGVMFTVAAFRRSVGWGLAVIFVPFASFVFLVKWWDETKRSFGIQIAGTVLIILAVLIAPASSDSEALDEAAHTPAETSRPSSSEQPSAQLLAAIPEPESLPAPARFSDSSAAEEQPQAPLLVQVYADNATRTFVSSDCEKRADNAFRMPKSIALRQGFAEAPCPR